MRKKLLRSALVGLAVLTLTSSLVFASHNAYNPVPDSGPFIDRVDVYRHLLETDDMLVVARYNVPYATAPPETIAGAFAGRFMDGTDELARVTPYSYFNSNGYGYGAFSMYLDAASAPTWEGSYTADLVGSPTLEWLGLTATTAVGGAVADDGGVQTDETTEANSAAANDMTLLPAAPVVDDAYYFSDTYLHSILTLNIGTSGDGVWTITWEYYDGTTWSTLSVTDGTSGFTAAAGNHDVTFTPPDDWSSTTVESITGYWIRARVSAYTSIVTQPLGTQSWVNSQADVPSVSGSSLSWRSSTTTSAARALLYTHLIAYARELTIHWSVDMTSDAAGGTVLSDEYGAPYFTNAILQLRSMCPQLFSAQVASPEYTDVDWQKTQAEAITESWPFDWGGISEWFGLPSDDEVFRTIVGFFVVFVICALIMAKTNRTDFTMLAGYGLLIVAAVPGWISPVIVAGFTFMTMVVAALIFVAGKT